MEASKDERERAFIRSREEKIQALEDKCQDLEANVDDLYKQLDVNEEVFLGNKELACTYQATAKDYKTRLAAAEKEIHDLQTRLREALTKKRQERRGRGKGRNGNIPLKGGTSLQKLGLDLGTVRNPTVTWTMDVSYRTHLNFPSLSSSEVWRKSKRNTASD